MLAAAPSPIAAAKPPLPVAAQTAQKTSQPQAPETARASAGETAAANIKSETVQALKAAEQGAVAPRLRDQERAESTDRLPHGIEAPAGPPPTFEESPLERQARVALEPPELSGLAEPGQAAIEDADPDQATAPEMPAPTLSAAPANLDPPPTPSERAEASFAETRTISDHKAPASVDVRN